MFDRVLNTPGKRLCNKRKDSQSHKELITENEQLKMNYTMVMNNDTFVWIVHINGKLNEKF